MMPPKTRSETIAARDSLRGNTAIPRHTLGFLQSFTTFITELYGSREALKKT
jgi:hypothetical protein